MILYPSIDSLMERIDSKYTLVTLSAKRARVIQQTENVYVDHPKSKKPVGKALEEVMDGKLLADGMIHD